MGRPIITFELSEDENSVFVYDADHDLIACMGMQRSDAIYQLQQYVGVAVAAHTQVHQLNAEGLGVTTERLTMVRD